APELPPSPEVAPPDPLLVEPPLARSPPASSVSLPASLVSVRPREPPLPSSVLELPPDVEVPPSTLKTRPSSPLHPNINVMFKPNVTNALARVEGNIATDLVARRLGSGSFRDHPS